MAGRKRRRNYTFMSQVPRTTIEAGNQTQDIDTNRSSECPSKPITLETNLQGTQLGAGQSEATTGSIPLTSSASDPSMSANTSKKGRGPAKGYQGKDKIHIIFNKYMQPIGDTSTDVANILGEIARCGARAPLDVVSWKSMPTTNLEIMWRDVQHKTDAPEEFKDNCLMLIGGHWKKWKSRVKSKHFTPFKNNPKKLLTPPDDSRIDPEKWPVLVNYWKREDVEAQSMRNATNRKHLEFLPRTGRTSHANIREEMKANNEDTSRAKVFIKTRSKKDGTIPNDDTKKLVERMNEKLKEIPESDQSDVLKEQVFTDLLGSEGHGRVRTFGVGPSPRVVFGAGSRSMNISSSDEIQRMVESQVEAQLEARVAERVAEQVAEQVAEKVAGYKKIQKDMIERMEMMQRLLVRQGLLEPSLQHDTRGSG